MRIFWLAMGCALVLVFGVIAVDATKAYYNYRYFPDPQKAFIEQLIADANMPNCNGTSAKGEQKILNECFTNSRLDRADVSSDGQLEEYGQLKMQFSCQVSSGAARFEIILNRSDPNIWCSYRFGKRLDDVAKIDGEAAIVAEPPGLLVVLLIKLFG
jgi:hypothetical protein